MSDSTKISIQSARLTLTADHTADDVEGIRQTLALLQTYLRTLIGERDAEPAPKAPRRARKPAPATEGGAR